MPDKFGWDNDFGNNPAPTRHKMRFSNEKLRQKILEQPDHIEEPADDVSAIFWCECGDPFSQDPETEKRERAAGKCLLCISRDQPR